MRRYFVLLMFLISFLYLSCDIESTSDDDSTTTATTTDDEGTVSGGYADQGFDDQVSMDFANYMVVEVNYARTNPSGYASARLKTYEDAGTDNGAYDQFTDGTFPAVGSLTLNAKLNAAADKRALVLATDNIFEHGDVQARIEAEGYAWSTFGENIAAGGYSYLDASVDAEEAAKEFVVMWIIDEGYPEDNAGHRINLMKSSFTELGVGYAYDASSSYENYSVQNFGAPAK